METEESAIRRSVGFGCSSASADYSGCVGSMPSPREYLARGLPTLALATLRGEMAPFNYISTALFPAVDAGTLVAQVNPNNNQLRAAQDTYCHNATFKILDRSETANSQIFSPESDFYFNQQSGIEIAVRILGGPGWNPMPSYTPITSLQCIMGAGWCLRSTEWPQMDVLATILLPFICSLQVTWCMYAPRCQREEYSRSRLAVQYLNEEFGITLPGA